MNRKGCSVSKLVSLYFDICLLRAGPQHLPVSNALVGLAVAAHVLVGVLLGLLSFSFVNAVGYALVSTFMVVGLTRIVLLVRNYPDRFKQTLSGLAGTDVLLGLVVWPITAWLYEADAQGTDVGTPFIFWLIVVAWSLVVTAHILRHALSVHYVIGFAVAVGYFVVSYSILATLFEAVV